MWVWPGLTISLALSCNVVYTGRKRRWEQKMAAGTHQVAMPEETFAMAKELREDDAENAAAGGARDVR